MSTLRDLLATCLVLVTTADAFFAYHIEKIGENAYLITCNDGTMYNIYGTGDDAINLANTFCEEHGGVALIEDADVIAAIGAGTSSCGLLSNVTVAENLGGGVYAPVTSETLDALMEGVPFGGFIELPASYEVVGLVINDVELITPPVGGLPPLPVTEIVSNEDDVGVPVSGIPAPAFCVNVPLPPLASGLIAAALALVGAMMVRSCTRDDGMSFTGKVSGI